MSKIFRIVACIIVLSSCSSKFGKVFKSKDNEYRYKMAEQYYSQKQYGKAQELYDALASWARGTQRFEDMTYKNAYCSYYLKDYLNAENTFKQYVEDFPTGLRVEECTYMRAYCFYKESPRVELDQTATMKAVTQMQSFLSAYPNSSRVKDAQNVITACRIKMEEKSYLSAQLYYDLGFLKASSVTFNLLMDDFPDSERLDEYSYKAIKAYYEYAKASKIDKQEERFKKVVVDCGQFTDHFQNSKYEKNISDIKQFSEKVLKRIENEQAKTTSQS
ncbi:MAG: outer membrane protein assembly factor BamD [Chitinophagaceae bacterium]|nr:outer membrane protein assembly factor BamD [Chitinophagaceae bacterium]